MTDTPEPLPPEPPPPPERRPEAPSSAETPPVPPPPTPPTNGVNWRMPAIIGAVLLVAAIVAAAWWFTIGQDQDLAQQEAPATVAVEEEEWPGLSDQDRLHVRPLRIARPVLGQAMQMAILSGYADVEFTVGENGRATDIRVVRESVRDLGYGAEGRRLVAGATWPTDWRGRTAPFDASYRVIFPPGRNAREIAPLSIASPNLTPEILALRRNVTVTLFVRVDEDGEVESARVVDSDVQNDAVTSEAMRVAMGARYPPSPSGVGYETQLIVRFDVLGARGGDREDDVPLGPTVTLSEVPFTQQPSASDFNRHYPRRARNAGVDGRVVLACVVQRNLRLGCNVAEEDPPGQGFATAALRLSRQFRAGRQFPDGRTTVGAQVRVPLVFRVQ